MVAAKAAQSVQLAQGAKPAKPAKRAKAAKPAKGRQSIDPAGAVAPQGSGVRRAVPMEQWPDKVLFRIGELADLLGVETHVVRFWLTEFPTVRTERSDTGRLLFARPAAERMLRIRVFLYEEGYTLAGARKALGTLRNASKSADGSVKAADQSAAAAVKASGPSKLETELQRQVETLQADLRALQARLAASQAGEAAARARAHEALEQLDAGQQDLAQQNHAEREQWSDLAAALGDLAAEIRG